MKLLRAAILLFTVYSVQSKSIGHLNDDVLDNTHFLLWNRVNPENYKELIIGDAAVANAARYDISLPTVIFIHGFLMNGHSDEQILKMRDEYLKGQDVNFISVDWEKIAAGPDYSTAVDNVKRIGELTSSMITFLHKYGTAEEKFHLVGFDLGAHAAGKAADTVDFAFARVTGLDPVYRGFSLFNTANRLDSDDAMSVDVIHTNSGSDDSSVSFADAIGHQDFYVNGGKVQLGCSPVESRNISDLTKSCSHRRALEYFIESINSKVGFTSTLCDSWDSFTAGKCADADTVQMGEHVEDAYEGMFYLSTNAKSPYAKTLGTSS